VTYTPDACPTLSWRTCTDCAFNLTGFCEQSWHNSSVSYCKLRGLQCVPRGHLLRGM
jgi:hypothetical protein